MKNDRSITVNKVVWSVLKHWRSIVIVALVCGSVLMGMRFYQDYNAAVASANATPPASLSEIRDSFSANELREIEYVRKYQNIIDSADRYFADSILMQIPYDKVVKVTLQYQVVPEEGIDVSTEALIAAYDNYVTSGEMSDAIVDRLQDDIEAQYITEILSVPTNEIFTSKKGNAVIYNSSEVIDSIFAVSLIHYDRNQALNIADIIKDVLQDYSTKLNKSIGAHSMVFQTENIGVEADYLLLETQNERVDAYDIVSGSYLGKLGNLTEQQTEVYNNWDDIDDGENLHEDVPEDGAMTMPAVQPSLRMFGIGAVAGAFVMICFWMLAYMCTKKVRGEMDFDACNIYRLGEKQVESGRKRLFSKVDRCIKRLEYENERKYSEEQIVKLIYSNIYLKCKKKNISMLCVTGSAGVPFATEAWYMELKELLKTKGIMLKECENIAHFADALLEASEIKNILLVETEYHSEFDSMVEEVEVCKNNDIDILGGIMLHA